MSGILQEQVNRPERMDPKTFLMTLVRMVLRLAVAQIVVTILVFVLKAPVLNFLFYAYAVAEVVIILRQILASDRYVLTASGLLLERRMGDMVLHSVNVPTDQMVSVREYAAGEKLPVSYAHVTEFRRQAKVPLNVRLGRGLAVFSARLARRCAGTAAGNPCGLVLAYYEGNKVKACTFEPDAGMLEALGKVLGERMGTDDRLARPHLRTFMARTQARAFPELYPHVLALVTPQDEAWAEAFEKKRKQEQARKKAQKEAKLAQRQAQRTPGTKQRKKKKKPAKGQVTNRQKTPEVRPEERSMEIPGHPVYVEVEYAPEKRKDIRRRRSRTREDEHGHTDGIV